MANNFLFHSLLPVASALLYREGSRAVAGPKSKQECVYVLCSRLLSTLGWG